MFGSKMFRVDDDVEPQRDATISSSNIQPMKWVKWLMSSYKDDLPI